MIIFFSTVGLLPHPMSTFKAITLFAIDFAIAIFLWQKLVIGWTEWQVDKNRITISWTKKFAFSNINDYVFEWKDIEKIWKGMDTNYYNLKFKFTTGQKITFYHSSFGKDDFNDLLEILNQILDERQKLQPTSHCLSFEI